MPTFSLGRVTEAAELGGLEIPRGFQQSLIVLLVPHYEGTERRRRYNCDI